MDRYDIGDPEIRDLFVAYLNRRYPEVDYSSLAAAAYAIVKVSGTESHGSTPIKLISGCPRRCISGGIARSPSVQTGNPTGHDDGPFADPGLLFRSGSLGRARTEVWARWVTTCPVPRSTMNQVGKAKRRVRERVHATVRTLQPLLPALVEKVSADHQRWSTCFNAPTVPVTGRSYVGTRSIRAYIRVRTTVACATSTNNGVRVRDDQTGRFIEVHRKEDSSFWSWAVVETLRHGGLRKRNSPNCLS